jgi:hypothetical protein
MTAYFDYRFRFLATESGKTNAAAALEALRAAGAWVGTNEAPVNMLGDPIPGMPGVLGAVGRAAFSYQEEGVGPLIEVAAVGDPAYYYVAIRTKVSPDKVPPTLPATFGLEAVDEETSAALLGVWA